VYNLPRFQCLSIAIKIGDSLSVTYSKPCGARITEQLFYHGFENDGLEVYSPRFDGVRVISWNFIENIVR
jgi:hypothetical protein